MPHFTMARRVQFADTDMAGIVHFANFYRYMEETEHAFFRTLGFKIAEEQPDGQVIGWPRVQAACRFEAPAYYDDLIDVELTIDRVGVKSLVMKFVFRRNETRLATGELKTVCCYCRAGGQIESIEIPPHYRARLEGAQSQAGAHG